MPAATGLHDVAPAALEARLARDKPDGHAREDIAGPRLHPLSSLTPAALPRDPNRKLVLQRNSGNRTRQAAAPIPAPEPIALPHLAGQARKEAVLPVEADGRTPLLMMRQVQIAAGSLVLLGLLLALLLSLWFALLSAFVGAGGKSAHPLAGGAAISARRRPAKSPARPAGAGTDSHGPTDHPRKGLTDNG